MADEGPADRAVGEWAGLGARFAARLIDTLAMGVCGAVGLAVSMLLAFVLLSSSGSHGAVQLAWVGSAAVIVLCAVCYEPLSFARWGTTFGKQLASVAAVGRFRGGHGDLGWGAWWLRWALPHAAFALGFVGGFVVARLLGAGELSGDLLAGLGAGTMAWTAVYGSAVLDPHGRGWHDRLAGTVVIAVPRSDHDTGERPAVAVGLEDSSAIPPMPARSKTAAAVLVAAASLGAGAAAVGGAYGLHAVFGTELDLYDEQVRAANTHLWWEGPEGDVCWWVKGDSAYSCDLVSVGGLHWDTGDLGTAERPRIHLGAGFMCLLDDAGMPRCWEWSADVAPRPARVPESEVLKNIHVVTSPPPKAPGAPGFACGESIDQRRVVCWSVGVDQPDYRQANHRATDGWEWTIRSIDDDPPRINVARISPPWVGDPPRRDPAYHIGIGQGDMHAFTGKPSSPMYEADMWPWVTDTIP